MNKTNSYTYYFQFFSIISISLLLNASINGSQLITGAALKKYLLSCIAYADHSTGKSTPAVTASFGSSVDLLELSLSASQTDNKSDRRYHYKQIENGNTILRKCSEEASNLMNKIANHRSIKNNSLSNESFLHFIDNMSHSEEWFPDDQFVEYDKETDLYSLSSDYHPPIVAQCIKLQQWDNILADTAPHVRKAESDARFWNNIKWPSLILAGGAGASYVADKVLNKSRLISSFLQKKSHRIAAATGCATLGTLGALAWWKARQKRKEINQYNETIHDTLAMACGLENPLIVSENALRNSEKQLELFTPETYKAYSLSSQTHTANRIKRYSGIINQEINTLTHNGEGTSGSSTDSSTPPIIITPLQEEINNQKTKEQREFKKQKQECLKSKIEIWKKKHGIIDETDKKEVTSLKKIELDEPVYRKDPTRLKESAFKSDFATHAGSNRLDALRNNPDYQTQLQIFIRTRELYIQPGGDHEFKNWLKDNLEQYKDGLAPETIAMLNNKNQTTISPYVEFQAQRKRIFGSAVRALKNIQFFEMTQQIFTPKKCVEDIKFQKKLQKLIPKHTPLALFLLKEKNHPYLSEETQKILFRAFSSPLKIFNKETKDSRNRITALTKVFKLFTPNLCVNNQDFQSQLQNEIKSDQTQKNYTSVNDWLRKNFETCKNYLNEQTQQLLTAEQHNSSSQLSKENNEMIPPFHQYSDKTTAAASTSSSTSSQSTSATTNNANKKENFKSNDGEISLTWARWTNNVLIPLYHKTLNTNPVEGLVITENGILGIVTSEPKMRKSKFSRPIINYNANFYHIVNTYPVSIKTLGTAKKIESASFEAQTAFTKFCTDNPDFLNFIKDNNAYIWKLNTENQFEVCKPPVK